MPEPTTLSQKVWDRHVVRHQDGEPDILFIDMDIISGGYALRNAPDLGITIDEVSRVLKPGGVAAFLDFSKPTGKFSQHIEYWLLKLWSGLWGILLHRNHEVYSYIAESLRRFPDRGTLHSLLQAKGYRIVTSRLYFFGITEIIVIEKSGL